MCILVIYCLCQETLPQLLSYYKREAVNSKALTSGVFLCLLAINGRAAQVTVDPNDSAIVRAQANLENVEKLVISGVLPRLRLDQAKENLVDSQDIAILHQTLYGKELTIDQADEMISAAQRRVDRKQRLLKEMQELLNRGIISKAEMGTYTDDADRANHELDWAKSRARLIIELSAMVRAEEDAEKLAALAESVRQAGQAALMHPLVERFDGNGQFSPILFAKVQSAYQKRFGLALPVSANGETAVHRALGFDHRGRVDVPVSPDQPEGVWLRRFLTDNQIPFFAFRSAVAHQATGAHIHLGPPSTACAVGSCPASAD
jgi:hypothetical protein